MFRRRRASAPGAPTAVRSDWRSYDGVAEAYDRVRAGVHEPPARDLVSLVGPAAGARVVDVGTGTGVAALAAQEAAGEGGFAVGVDRSLEMLRLANVRGVRRLVGVDAIDLPFRDATFDAATIVFVLHLVRRPDTVLFDVMRVLRPGGTIGVATWASGDDEFTRTWREIAETYATKEMLADALRRAAPSHDRFTDEARLTEALRGSGARDVRVERRRYRSSMSIDDYLVGRDTAVLGRFMRDVLGATLWTRFREQVRAEFTRRFADPLGDSNEVLLAVGTKE